MHRRSVSVFALLPLALSTQAYRLEAQNAAVVYQNTMNPTGRGFGFNGAVAVGQSVATNIDVNQLNLAPSSAGAAVVALSFLAYSANSGTVQARPTMYLWAADGTGASPSTLLGSFPLPVTSFAPNSQQQLNLTLPGGGIPVPGNQEVWAGIGFDNASGTSSITAQQLNGLGGLTYNPATIGTDGPNSYNMGPASSLTNPPITFFQGNFSGNYGWTVQASAFVNTFFNGEQLVGASVEYLQFQDGNPFGYYGFLEGSAGTQSAWLYHFDLGYEYVIEGSTAGSVYLYDNASGHWWYSSSSLFPYLYDFTLNAWIYYFPNTKSPGHYTTSPRNFVNLTTSAIFAL